MTKAEHQLMKEALEKRIEALIRAASKYSEEPKKVTEYIRNSVHTVYEVGVEVGKSLLTEELFNPGPHA